MERRKRVQSFLMDHQSLCSHMKIEREIGCLLEMCLGGMHAYFTFMHHIYIWRIPYTLYKLSMTYTLCNVFQELDFLNPLFDSITLLCRLSCEIF